VAQFFGIFAGDKAHETSQRFRAGLHRHINMIGHPAIRVNAMSMPFDGILDKFLPSLAVLLVAEYIQPDVATQYDLIEAAGDVNPGFAWHVYLETVAVSGTGEVMAYGPGPQGEFMGE